jgi:hypothetical protein
MTRSSPFQCSGLHCDGRFSLPPRQKLGQYSDLRGYLFLFLQKKLKQQRVEIPGYCHWWHRIENSRGLDGYFEWYLWHEVSGLLLTHCDNPTELIKHLNENYMSAFKIGDKSLASRLFF